MCVCLDVYVRLLSVCVCGCSTGYIFCVYVSVLIFFTWLFCRFSLFFLTVQNIAEKFLGSNSDEKMKERRGRRIVSKFDSAEDDDAYFIWSPLFFLCVVGVLLVTALV